MNRTSRMFKGVLPLLPQIAGLGSAAFGILALPGWILEFPWLAGFGGDLAPMAPSTAFLLLVIGISLFILSRYPRNQRARMTVKVLASIPGGSLSSS